MNKKIKPAATKIYNKVEPFFTKSKEDSLSAYAAQTTFYIILSFFPFFFLIFLASKNISFMWNNIINYILKVIPDGMDKYVFFVVDDLLYSGQKTITVVTVVLALWSSAKGVQALSYGLDKIYCVERKKNYFITRLFSILYIFAFLLLGMVVMLLDILADRIIKYISEKSPYITEEAILFIGFRSLFAFVALFVFILMIYCNLPARRGRIKSEFWGAAAAAILWMAMTKILTFYIKYISNMSYMYGGFSSIIVLIMWLYIGIQIILYGAVFNYYREQQRTDAGETEVDTKKCI